MAPRPAGAAQTPASESAQERGGASEQADGPTFALYASFAADPDRPLPPQHREPAAAHAQQALDSSEAILRGAYTVTGYRADADLLLWLVGHSADAVQDALIAFRQTQLGQALRVGLVVVNDQDAKLGGLLSQLGRRVGRQFCGLLHR